MNSWLKLTVLLCGALLAAPLSWSATALNFGIFAYRPKPIMQAQYNQLGSYLSEQLGRPVNLRYLDMPELQQALEHKQLDVVFTNPSHFHELRSQSSLSGALVTAVKSQGDLFTNSLGGVIITRAGEPADTPLVALKGRSIATPGTGFFGGYRAQAFELQSVGVYLPAQANIQQLGNHDAVVQAVLQGKAAFGFIRTGVLESLAARKQLDLAALTVVNPQQLVGFPFLASTRLYPEWPVVAMPHLDQSTIKQLVLALLSLEADHPAARAAGLKGFAPVSDYSSVEQVLRQLRLPPYDYIPDFNAQDIVRRYWPWVVALLVLGSALAIALLLITVMYRRQLQVTEQLVQADEQHNLLASVFSHAGEAIFITDRAGNILEVNDAFTRITGYSREEITGKNPKVLQSGHHDAAFYQAMWRALGERGEWSGEVWNRGKDGHLYAQLLTITTIVDHGGQLQRYLAIFSDITLLKKQQQQLEHLAHFDPLTGLANRVLLGDRLQQAMAQAARTGIKLAVIYLDLDGFKAVNDTHGHDVGDELLKVVTSRMQAVLRDSDTLARLGGDEFVIVLVGIDGSINSVLDRLLKVASQPVVVNAITLQVSASMGVALFEQRDGSGPEQLLRHADQAMYSAKLAGKNRYCFFDQSQDDLIRHINKDIARIEQALANHELVLFYQPKVNMRSGKLVGVEALLRWQHPERGLLAPGAFLSVVEDHELIVPIGQWVIETVLSQLEAWQAQGFELNVSINVAARQVQQDNFVEQLQALLAAHPSIEPGQIEFEILETSAFEDLDGVAEVIRKCEALGLRFAIDDFGTGYASLSYLRQLPARRLKIDQSFVGNMLDSPKDLSIVEAVVALSRSMRRSCIAEGVETVEHGEILLMLGCDEGQGYAIAKPMPPEQLYNWSVSWKPSEQWAGAQSVRPEHIEVLHVMADSRAWIKALQHQLQSKASADEIRHANAMQLRSLVTSLAKLELSMGVHLVPACEELNQLSNALIDLYSDAEFEQLHQAWPRILQQHEALIERLKGLIYGGEAV